MSKDGLTLVIPCSGIGKALGQISRIAAYKVIEEKPENARTLCLALLTVGDEEAAKLVSNTPCIAIDGCPKQCSSKNIMATKGKIVAKFMVTDVLKKNRGLKPEGIIELNADGQKLAELLAKEVVDVIDGMVK